MPTYDYECRGCGARLEIFHGISEAPKRKCPQCGARKLERKIGAGAGILFKGGGFYQTDYRSDSYKQAAKAEQGGGDAKGEAKPDIEGDSKPQPKAEGKAEPSKSDGGKAAKRETPKKD